MLSRIAYNLLLSITLPLFLIYWLIQSVQHQVPLKRIRERFGFLPPLPRNALWIHAASIGELKVALSLKPFLQDQGPVIISSSTSRGATTDITDFFLPYDHPWCIQKALRTLKPKALLLIETEIWPNLILKASCPTFLINARLSKKSFKRYQHIQYFITPAIKSLTGIWCSGKADADRLNALGGCVGEIHPNIKYLNIKKPDPTEKSAQDAYVFSCTHPGEEHQLVPLFEKIIASKNDAKLVVIPRHAHRKKSLEQQLQKFKNNLHIEDRFGYTHHWYARAKVVFMGGSLIPHGGQNPIEPLAYGCRTIIGPYVHNFQAIVDSLTAHNLLNLVSSVNELPEFFKNTTSTIDPWPFITSQQQQIKASLTRLSEKLRQLNLENDC